MCEGSRLPLLVPPHRLLSLGALVPSRRNRKLMREGVRRSALAVVVPRAVDAVEGHAAVEAVSWWSRRSRTKRRP